MLRGTVTNHLHGDEREDEQRYIDTISGADLLIDHMAVGSTPDPVAATLQTTPDRLGRVAAQAGVKAMVLSHLMPRALQGSTTTSPPWPITTAAR